MNKTEAKQAGVIIGRLTTTRDSQGEYQLKEDGYIVSEGYYDTAAEIKADYIQDKVDNNTQDWEA
jgi:hypothetical protein